MKIVDLMEATFALMGIPFGNGPREYGNLGADILSDGVKLDPVTKRRAWMYPHQVLDLITPSNALKAKYSVLIDIHELGALDLPLKEIRNKLSALESVAREFELRLSKNVGVIELKDFKREPLFHEFDDSFIGWIIKFEITIDEAIDYPCP